jgi:hypothetical protein
VLSGNDELGRHPLLRAIAGKGPEIDAKLATSLERGEDHRQCAGIQIWYIGQRLHNSMTWWLASTLPSAKEIGLRFEFHSVGICFKVVGSTRHRARICALSHQAPQAGGMLCSVLGTLDQDLWLDHYPMLLKI